MYAQLIYNLLRAFATNVNIDDSEDEATSLIQLQN